MKNIILFFLSSFVLIYTLQTTAYATDDIQLLPEDIAARSEMSASHKTITVFIEEDKPLIAAQKLNDSNNEYARQGWVLFAITPYVEDEDFEGFFATYKKALTEY